MANWQNTIDISGILHNDDTTINDKGKELAKRIQEFGHFEKYRDPLNDIAMQFEEVESVEEFDYLLDELYDWGDTPLDDNWNGRKMCWINTFAKLS